MPVTRNLSNGNKLVDWTDEVNEVENQYGVLNDMGLFNEKGVSQTAVVFDKNEHQITLLPQSTRGSRQATKGKDRTVKTYSLALPYFKHQDELTAEDVQSWRMAGTPDAAEIVANVKADKITDMRLAVDQTKEYMKIQAIKGVTKDAEGTVLADMFTEFGVSQDSTDFLLGTAGTDVDAKIATVKRNIAKNIKGGGAISGIMLMVDESFFDKLISHPAIRDSYLQYQNSGVQQMRDDLSRYLSWGVSDLFTHRGVTFATYGATFTLPDGTTEDAFAADEGFSIVRGPRDLYRGYNGPSSKLSGANVVGSPVYMYEYADPKDDCIELEAQFASLYMMTKPKVSQKVTTSN